MNTLSAVAFLAALAFANAGLLAGPSANIIQGPSSRSTIVGPDGSAISAAVAPAGQIITEQQPGLIAQTAPVVAAPLLANSASVWTGASPLLSRSVLAAPGLIAGSPLVAGVSPLLSRSVLAAPGLIAESPLVAGGVNTVVSGPSGVITRSDLVAPGLISQW